MTRLCRLGISLCLLVLTLAACAPGAGPRPITAGTACATCGMAIQDLRFACEDRRDGRHRFYDAIECLVRAGPGAQAVWLADYDTRTLLPADSVWVVQADIPSPMGGGLAAFRERAAAEEIARERRGHVGRFAEIASPGSARSER